MQNEKKKGKQGVTRSIQACLLRRWQKKKIKTKKTKKSQAGLLETAAD